MQGRVALVTGAGRGIGRAIAERLAREGWAVGLLARSPGELDDTARSIAAAGGRAWPYAADVTDREAVATAVAELERRFGDIDLLVNNAAILGPIEPLWTTDPADWWRTFDINVRGPMLCLTAVLPQMVARRQGRVINVISGTIPFAYYSGYLASKAALIRLTECLALELRPVGVAAFAMGPGTVSTSMSEYSRHSPDGQQWIPWFDRIFSERLDLPVERPAALAAALASGAYDDLTGLVLTPADDLDTLRTRVDEISRGRLHSLRVRTLDDGNAGVDAVRAAGEAFTTAADRGGRLRIETEMAAPRGEVFGAWIDATLVRRWFVTADVGRWLAPPAIDARAGGTFDWRVRGAAPDVEFRLSGTYREIRPPERLVFEWRWDPNAALPGHPPTTVMIELRDRGARTGLVLTHAGFENEQARAAHARGWQRCLASMAALFEPQ
jgi:NAD(P)-dependent dehydrogenase (short-subunit alcohol dehydrogenase family)/uncharacterized protein YndB with AHSA1/START domain